jgi:putative mRNA 3-end processing factor
MRMLAKRRFARHILDWYMRAEDWIRPTPQGLYVEPGGFFIDPARPAPRAVLTHGHADHARPGNGDVLATGATLAILRARYGDAAGTRLQAAAYGETLRLGDVTLRLVPAGHVLGSAQIVLEHAGSRVVVSGDYKRRRDPTCPGFEPVRCDVFVTEATFGLPVFVHPDDGQEIGRLLDSVRRNPERAHLVGVYALGKCQRVIRLLREAGWDRPIFLHAALAALCAVYESEGVALGELRPASAAGAADLAGGIVLAPPGALADRWSRRLPEPLAVAASGWMRIRQRARQRGVELPLVISDHADWPELLQSFAEVDAPEIWVTHGQEDALVHAASLQGRRARALRLIGREADEET